MSSSGGGGLSNLGISLVIIFAIALLAIFAQVFYIIWRRLAFRRRTSAASSSRYSSSESTPSKELLYFFCVRPQLDLDRTSPAAIDGRNSNRESDVEVIDIDLLKIEGVFGPPRFLFTIKEEEKEGTESPAKTAVEIVGDEKRGGVSLEECFRSEEETVEVKIDDCSRDDDATPFSTPCASPLYFTPTASPVHAVVNARSTGVAV
ncbi:uncharacterized protein LOC125201802 [Salvia hispanica]|uniref:uncharacterized protein LOC125201802 n=1 Tax=Salvia hispanica TaxID=49212 RepID=UPI002009A9B2|nr:uncharacterized protein LOC125201802 [Salvia hispanica]